MIIDAIAESRLQALHAALASGRYPVLTNRIALNDRADQRPDSAGTLKAITLGAVAPGVWQATCGNLISGCGPRRRIEGG